MQHPTVVPEIGTVFGRLVVESAVFRRSDGISVVQCRCSCGVQVSVKPRCLRAGEVKSCGCGKYRSLVLPEIGSIFGRLTVETTGYRGPDGLTLIQCRCVCGSMRSLPPFFLWSGKVKSCGCSKHDAKQFTHRMSKTSEYKTWSAMLERCRSVTHQAYSLYGGRGISVCERWEKFQNFYADMGPRPTPKHSIERVDNDGPYAPGNCVWATQKEQNRNRRNNRLLTMNGETKPAVQWAEELNISPDLVYNRLCHGWTHEAALNPSKRVYVKRS